jgi:hypothetical protein
LSKTYKSSDYGLAAVYCDLSGKGFLWLNLTESLESQAGDDQFKIKAQYSTDIELKESFNIPLLTSIYFSPVNIE